MGQLKPLDEKLEDEITELLSKYKEEIESGTFDNISNTTLETSETKTNDKLKEVKEEKHNVVMQKSSAIDPLQYYNSIKSKVEREKKAKRQKLSDDVVQQMWLMMMRKKKVNV